MNDFDLGSTITVLHHSVLFATWSETPMYVLVNSLFCSYIYPLSDTVSDYYPSPLHGMEPTSTRLSL